MRCRMQHSQEGPQIGLNPYGLPLEPSETGHLCPHELYNRMTTDAMMALFLNYLLTDRGAPRAACLLLSFLKEGFRVAGTP